MRALLGTCSRGQPQEIRARRPPASPTLYQELWRNEFPDKFVLEAHTEKKMKHLIRMGLPHSLRSEIWEVTTGADQLLSACPRIYEDALRDTFPWVKDVCPAPTQHNRRAACLPSPHSSLRIGNGVPPGLPEQGAPGDPSADQGARRNTCPRQGWRK